jgi:glycosyltransferase involved in cell wall biosynthesis
MKKRILLKAPILTQSGYGEHGRFVFRVLLEREDLFDIYVEPLNWGKTGWQWESSEERKTIDQCIAKFHRAVSQEKKSQLFDVCIHVDLPTAWKRVAPVMIGVTAGIEADAVSPHWLQPSYEQVDKIIVPSEFSKEGFLSAVDKYSPMFDEPTRKELPNLKADLENKISVVHYPVKDYNLIDLGIDFETDFNFLLVAQWSPRKNIKETMRAFLDEFQNDDVGLVLKTNLARNCTPDRFLVEKKVKSVKSEYPDAKCKIYLLHGFMTEDEIHSLYHHPKIKATINFGHGEGFGLPLFEAAYCGLPIITHDFGGQKDFLYAPKKNKKGKETLRPYFSKIIYNTKPVDKKAIWEGVIEKDAEWAYPNFNSCKMAMRDIFADNKLANGQAKRLKTWVKKTFSKKEKYEDLLESCELVQPLKEADYVFVSDMFADEYTGGAELSLQTLIDTCPSSSVNIKSSGLSEHVLDFYKNSVWVFANVTQANTEIINKISESGIKYYVSESDYKYCEHRLPQLCRLFNGGEDCSCGQKPQGKLYEKFYNAAQTVFFRSEKQKKHYEEALELKSTNTRILSALFSEDFFNKIEKLKNKYKDKKSNKWIISNSPSWVKGTVEAENWCKENEKEYTKLHNLSYDDALESLAEAEGLCFLPRGSDTCPRLVIEAKLLGCELEINDNVLHASEKWFDAMDESVILDHLKQQPANFWSVVSTG